MECASQSAPATDMFDLLYHGVRHWVGCEMAPFDYLSSLQSLAENFVCTLKIAHWYEDNSRHRSSYHVASGGWIAMGFAIGTKRVLAMYFKI